MKRERISSWFKMAYAKKLRRLHAVNGWTVLLLAVTGLLLYAPFFRGDIFGVSIRVPLKQLHIALGIFSIVLLLSYAPLIGKHIRQLRGKFAQQWNLGLVLCLLIGWIVSGIILTWNQGFLKPWSATSLWVHDFLTWIGIPWTVYHSLTRLRWIKQKTNVATAASSSTEKSVYAPTSQGWYRDGHRLLSRRQWIQAAVGVGIAALIGPYFYRWLKAASDGGEQWETYLAEEASGMLPAPNPLPQSLPPTGGGSKGTFRIYTVTDMPKFSSENWHFSVSGLVDRPLQFDWKEFLELPRKVQVSDFHCVTGWSVLACTWEGIPLSALLDKAGVQSKAKFVKFYSGDGVYTDAMSLKQSRLDDVMIAVLLDGKPLPQQLGGPVRLIVPKMYAYKSVKWLQSVELIEKDHIGYWEVRGYDKDAWVPGQRPQI